MPCYNKFFKVKLREYLRMYINNKNPLLIIREQNFSHIIQMIINLLKSNKLELICDGDDNSIKNIKNLSSFIRIKNDIIFINN